ncbi:MAG TPA: pyruvate dehydrogenase complex dihydrolipoyllysine-residue acetyltransferase, partial [Atlantibacter hermannii]|nr:pyruvate dehydrogenase complex dihydrolipoyllysine-residue acetyltransferase [Atlantibacter hermannii]
IKISTGDKVKTGSPIMVFEVEGAAPAAAPAAKQEAAAPAPAAKAEKPAAAPAKAEGKTEFAENDAYVHATPLIRRLAREFGVNLAKVKGTGRKGRILREDVQA